MFTKHRPGEPIPEDLQYDGSSNSESSNNKPIPEDLQYDESSNNESSNSESSLSKYSSESDTIF